MKAAIKKFTAAFISDDTDSEDRRRILLLIGLSLIGIVFLIIFSIVAYLQNNIPLAAIDLVMAAVLTFNLVDAIRRKSWQQNIYAGIGFVSIFYIYLYASGGIGGTAFVWYFTYPLISCYLLGARKGSIAAALMLVPVAVIIIINPTHPFFAQYSSSFAPRFIAAYLVVAVFSYLFEATQERNAKELREINKSLEDIVAIRTREIMSINEMLKEDIKRREIAEKALEQSEERYRTIFDRAGDAIFILDASKEHLCRIIDANNAAAAMHGYTREALIGLNIKDLDAPGDAEKAGERIKDILSGKWINAEVEHLRKDGSRFPVEISAGLVETAGSRYILAIDRDVTARRDLDRVLRKSETMDAIGALAGGITHDFNNLLMGIQGRVSLMGLEPDIPAPMSEHIDAIDEYIQSAANLTKQLLGLARGGKYEVKPFDINDLAVTALLMFARTHKEICIHNSVQGGLLVVEADRYQIEQVLLNIFLNASHAMPDGGDLHLSTEEVAISDNESALLDIQPGRYTQISITDTGIGMDETVRRRIFEPFFTTKEKDRGTGLGLASAYGIIKNHDGTITVESDVGQGTTFNIYLPLSDKTPEQAASVKGPVMKGSETVMLVDDEEMILQVNAAIMKKLGYRVILARGGEQAINEVQKNGAEIDLVILDMIMPGINGGKTFDCIRVIQPSIPVILSSGYAIDGDASDILSRGCNGFIQKPFRVEDISRKIRLVLDEAKSDADIAAST